MNLEHEFKSDEYRDVLISIKLDAKTNALLTQTSKRSGRTKRKEAQIRLEDHLKKYSSISEISRAIER